MANQQAGKTVRIRIAAAQAILISGVILGLFYYWFGVADRYAVFLYKHLGSTPFDAVTRGRYWMAGLVACGMILVGYTAANGVWGLLFQGDVCPPGWQPVWLFSAPLLAAGIPLITMTVNQPTLPLKDSAACTVATLAGLALALMPGQLAAERPVALVWPALDGAGLVPVLLLLRAVELPSRGVSIIGPAMAYLFSVGSVVTAVVWLWLTTILQRRYRRPLPGAGAILVSSFCQTYLLLPLAHHLLATPPQYRYITTASNFFAFRGTLQAITFAVAVGLAVGVTQLRKRWP